MVWVEEKRGMKLDDEIDSMLEAFFDFLRIIFDSSIDTVKKMTTGTFTALRFGIKEFINAFKGFK